MTHDPFPNSHHKKKKKNIKKTAAKHSKEENDIFSSNFYKVDQIQRSLTHPHCNYFHILIEAKINK